MNASQILAFVCPMSARPLDQIDGDNATSQVHGLPSPYGECERETQTVAEDTRQLRLLLMMLWTAPPPGRANALESLADEATRIRRGSVVVRRQLKRRYVLALLHSDDVS